MTDLSRNHIENLKKRVDDLEKILALNERAIILYNDLLTGEGIGIIRAQNEIVKLEIQRIQSVIGE